MNGIHDMGGMQGLGEIGYRENEPGFHEAWKQGCSQWSGPCGRAVCVAVSKAFQPQTIFG